MTELFDKFLINNNPNAGLIRADASCMNQESVIRRTVNDIRKGKLKNNQRNNIVEDPLFVNSKSFRGIQLADAVAYCTQRHLNRLPNFDDYWEILEDKFFKDPKGNYENYGLKIFPTN